MFVPRSAELHARALVQKAWVRQIKVPCQCEQQHEEGLVLCAVELTVATTFGQGLRDAVVKHSMDDRQLGTAVDGLLRDMEAGEAGRFWAWESRLDARAVLSRTLEEQNAIIAAIMMKVDRALAVMGNLGQL